MGGKKQTGSRAAQLRAASARVQHNISEAQGSKKATEEAERRLAVSEAERQAIAQQMGHAKTIISWKTRRN